MEVHITPFYLKESVLTPELLIFFLIITQSSLFSFSVQTTCWTPPPAPFHPVSDLFSFYYDLLRYFFAKVELFCNHITDSLLHSQHPCPLAALSPISCSLWEAFSTFNPHDHLFQVLIPLPFLFQNTLHKNFPSSPFSWELCSWFPFPCIAYFWGILSTHGSY